MNLVILERVKTFGRLLDLGLDTRNSFCGVFTDYPSKSFIVNMLKDYERELKHAHMYNKMIDILANLE